MGSENKGLKNKRIIELEAVFKKNRYYVFRADGVDFKEFRVGKLNSQEFAAFHSVMLDVIELAFKQFDWIKVAYVFDDEINLAFSGENVKNKRRIHKNLSVLTSFISVQFNKLVASIEPTIKLKRKGEYYFDGRFIEIRNKKDLIDYFIKEQKKSHSQVKNLLSSMGDTGKKPPIEKIISDFLAKSNNMEKYRCLFGSFMDRKMKKVQIQNSLIKYISDFTELVLTTIN